MGRADQRSHARIDLGCRVSVALPPCDNDGFLCDVNDWSMDVAELLATQEGITLTPAHVEILDQLRAFHQAFDHSPAMRPLCRYLKQQLGADKASSLYLLSLFPNSPAKLAAKIAGLPRPENCL